MKIIASLAVSLVALTAALPASAQFNRPDDAVKYRKAALTVMNTHMGRLGAMASGRVPFDAKSAQDNAQVVADLARLPWAGFAPGTERLSNGAKPEIWTEQAKFKEHADRLVSESAKLLAASKTNNLDALKAAFGATANSCKACHDSFRAM